MKGCTHRALLSLLSLVAAVVAISAALERLYGVAVYDSVPAALIGGFFLWVSGNLLMATTSAWRERATIAAGLAGTTPADGHQTILAGRIEPVGPALRAPLSGRECIAYRFEIYALLGSGRNQRRVVYCDGIGLTPSTIATPAGSFRLLAVPELECDESLLDAADSMARAAEVIRSASFVPPPKPFTRPSIEQQWNDDDGEFKRERRYVEGEVDLAECRLMERALERGASVCVFGHYSATKRAIVADPADWSKITRVMKGSAESIVAQLGSSIVRRAVGTLVFAALAAGTIAAFLSA